MCGIAGLYSRDGGPVDVAPLDRLIGALAHRGPDGHGTHVDAEVGLAHRRLSILDPTEAGAQPMRRGAVVLVHNGEIYNYLELGDELRALGEVITSGSDTEVILAAYDRWGPDAVARFNGMFAFALWDGARRRLVLARDRMGVKPMYLRRTRRTLAFASEPMAFVTAAALDPDDAWIPEPHLGVVHDFLTQGWTDHSRDTFLDGVTALPAAHLLIVEDGRERLVRYWDTPPLADDGRPTTRNADRARDDALVDEFRATFEILRPPAAAFRRPARLVPVGRPRLVVDRHDRGAAAWRWTTGRRTSRHREWASTRAFRGMGSTSRGSPRSSRTRPASRSYA